MACQMPVGDPWGVAKRHQDPEMGLQQILQMCCSSDLGLQYVSHCVQYRFRVSDCKSWWCEVCRVRLSSELSHGPAAYMFNQTRHHWLYLFSRCVGCRGSNANEELSQMSFGDLPRYQLPLVRYERLLQVCTTSDHVHLNIEQAIKEIA